MFKFVKSFEVKFPVWVDGVKTDATETRVKVLFYEESEFNGLYRRVYGSAVTRPGSTTEEVNKMWDPEMDYSEHLKMVAVADSDFCKVVPR